MPSVDPACQITVPLLRWVGGKQKLARALGPRIHSFLENRIYVEPFLGAASFFLNLTPPNAVLADKNQLLIDCYRWVSSSPEKVWRALRPHIEKDSIVHYYATRDTFNARSSSIEQAARFIYLNRTCFNGVFRVNTNGAYNVPYGHKERPRFPSKQELIHTGSAFGKATITCASFESTLGKVGREHFVYLDPPYPPLDETAYFRHYTADRFEQKDQLALSKLVARMDKRRAKLLLTMPDTEATRKLYASFRVQKLQVVRYVSCQQKKRRVPELLISNFDF